MNTRPWVVLASVALFIIVFCGGPSVKAETNLVTDLDPDPNVFLCDLTATNLDVNIVTNNGTALITNTVHAMVYKDENAAGWPQGAGIPIPFMKLKPGEKVICRFKNRIPPGGCGCLDEGTSIHWHGIELDNDSDGTGVTQDSVLNGQSYTYKFIAPRPGLFWFHSHMMPGNTTFAGMYGAIIITNNIEGSLITNGVLPSTAYTYTLAMADIEYGTNGVVGKMYDPGDGTNVITTINELGNICHETGSPNSGNGACNAAGVPGQVVLVNGKSPITITGAESPKFTVPGNKRIRLQLLNEAISRNFYLKLLDKDGNQIDMLRVGGQGGLLNNMRLEGGTNDTWDTKYTKGAIVIGSGDRVDVVAYTGTNGPLKLVGNPLPNPFRLSSGLPSNYPVAFFTLSGTASDTAPTNGTPLAAGTVDEMTNLTAAATNELVNPAPYAGSSNSRMRLTNGSLPSIDNVDGHDLDGNMGNGSFEAVPRPASARYARIGDLVELSVSNGTAAVHPFHLHGFSFQPVKILNAAGATLFAYNYQDFLDTIDVYAGQTLVFRVPLEDRPKFCDESPTATSTNGPYLKPCTESNCGGGLGRWLFHCHIFLHAGVGMISELTVLENNSLTNVAKYVKQPDLTPTGVDVQATFALGSRTVADDFLCTATGPISRISIWGSWRNDLIDTNATFELKFWTDVPAVGPIPSHPGVQLWRHVFPAGTYSNTFENYVFFENFYNPAQPAMYFTDTQVWRYDFTIPPCDAFYQNYGNIYWLSVTAYTTNGTFFGWKTCVTNDYFNDDATWSPTTNSPTGWTDLHYPSGPPFFHPYTNSMDMAFELDTAIPTNCVPPTASFYGSPTSGSEPLMVTFTDISTGDITNRFWDFGDGDTTNTTLTSVDHTYTGGTYSVTLTVTGPCGTNTSTLTDYITVTGCEPVAGFFGSPTYGAAPLLVSFYDTSTGTITNWFWDFGDGDTTNLAFGGVSHTYTAGTYTVELIVSGPCGDGTNILTDYITALTPLQSWQDYYFGSTNNPNGAPNADPDGDGLNNSNEYLLGFNPVYGGASLRIISVVRLINNDVRITYLGPDGDTGWSPGVASRTNILEFTRGKLDGTYSNNFTSTGRTNVLSGGSGFGVVTNFVDIGGATNRPSRYYRIRVLAP